VRKSVVKPLFARPAIDGRIFMFIIPDVFYANDGG
jgi:hypothetical protein